MISFARANAWLIVGDTRYDIGPWKAGAATGSQAM